MVIYLIMADLEELFIKAQISEIIIHYGKLGSTTTMWRWFRNQNPNIPNSRISSVRTFSRPNDPAILSLIHFYKSYDHL